MINPVSVIKMLNERKSFVSNHPEFIGFILDTFGKEMVAGDKITIQVQKKDKEPDEMCIRVQETDIALFDELKKVVEQIRN